jgi:hypothetical protein
LPAAGDDVASDPAKAEPWRALSPKGIAAAITSTTTATTARNLRREGGSDESRGSGAVAVMAILPTGRPLRCRWSRAVRDRFV